jgi:SAM-dependent methyltransferase
MSALDAVMENVHVYRWWQAPFAVQKFAPVARLNDLDRAGSVLDVACGPGTNAAHFRRAAYMGVDWNPAYVEYARRRFRGEFVVADVCDGAFAGGRRFDFILVNSFFHHVADDDATRIMRRLGDLLTPGGAVHILDMIVPDRSGPARFLATHDRGLYPRSRARWETMMCDVYEPAWCEPYDIGAFGLPLWHMLYFKGRPR